MLFATYFKNKFDNIQLFSQYFWPHQAPDE